MTMLKVLKIPGIVLITISCIILGGSAELNGDIVAFADDDSLETIQAKIEQNGYEFTVGHNWVYDMPAEMKEEFFSRRPGDSPVEEDQSDDIGPLKEHLGKTVLPTSFDWRNYNGHSYIGAIRDQGYCGSCYAFGACAAAEGTYNWARGRYDGNCVDFSESFIIWCLGKYGSYSSHFSGCDGADYDYQELEALTVEGVCLESSFPYIEYDPGSCEHWSDPRTVFESWHRVPCNDIEAIKTAIVTYGVVDAAVYAGSAFQAYLGGIYSDSLTTCSANPCYYTSTNHAIALVGWDDNGGNGYWILRNSWGSSWGEGGYMRIKYTSARASCEVCYMVYYNTPTPTPTPTPTKTPTSPVPTLTMTVTVPPTPEMSPTPTPSGTASSTPTSTPTASGAPTPVVNLAPNKTVVETGDSLVVNLAINERISGVGNLVAYVVVQTPGSAWFSFVPNARGGFDMKSGIKPAAGGAVIPAVNLPILRQNITGSLARGDYWFISAVFHAGDRMTLANWRSKAIYSSEVTVTVK